MHAKIGQNLMKNFCFALKYLGIQPIYILKAVFGCFSMDAKEGQRSEFPGCVLFCYWGRETRKIFSEMNDIATNVETCHKNL